MPDMTLAERAASGQNLGLETLGDGCRQGPVHLLTDGLPGLFGITREWSEVDQSKQHGRPVRNVGELFHPLDEFAR